MKKLLFGLCAFCALAAATPVVQAQTSTPQGKFAIYSIPGVGEFGTFTYTFDMPSTGAKVPKVSVVGKDNLPPGMIMAAASFVAPAKKKGIKRYVVVVAAANTGVLPPGFGRPARALKAATPANGLALSHVTLKKSEATKLGVTKLSAAKRLVSSLGTNLVVSPLQITSLDAQGLCAELPTTLTNIAALPAKNFKPLVGDASIPAAELVKNLFIAQSLGCGQTAEASAQAVEFLKGLFGRNS